MKVYLNKPRDHWLSPYTVLEKVLFWKDWDNIDYDTPWVELWSDRLNPLCLALQKVLTVFHPKIDYVKIDRWDCWSMDATLAQIILPMLKQLKVAKQGAPFTDDEDVPAGQGLRSTEAPPKQNPWDTDDNHFTRFEWILDELIWTFTQLHPDTDWEDQYHSGEHDTIWIKSDKMYPNPISGKSEHTYQMSNGANHTHVFDSEGHALHQARITNGLKLFGKYFQALWD